MDIKKLFKGIPGRLEKYKYVVLIVGIGIVLMMIPGLENKDQESQQNLQITTEQTTSIQEELEQILSQVKGAGKVRILLKEKIGEEKVFHFNEDTTVSDSSTSTRIETVTVTDADRNENGLITKIIAPTYMGAIVLCQGADDPSVKLAVADAVSKITGLGTDRITVLKMK